jgi:cephalosporin-C deacetylase-like acetyl esterase
MVLPVDTVCPMNEPHDFGLSPLETLAHVGSTRPAPGHGPFWQRWHERLWATDPRLTAWRSAPGDAVDPGCGGVTHTFESVGHVRIGARLIRPESGEQPVGGIVLLHGAGAESDLDDRTPFDESGCLILRIRVRGFPGSRLDMPSLTTDESWITHGLADDEGWILPGAVADVVNAFRALRAELPEDAPVSIAGESLGGGLAVIGAAQLMGRLRVHRLAIGLPSLGDWEWRLSRASGVQSGLGAEVDDYLRRHPATRDQAAQRLALCDAAVHARKVVCPTLCKLAIRDDVVPAPAAAAVFNSLGTSPAVKWRFQVGYGHFDAGLSDLRRHGLFERLAGRFLDPREDLGVLMPRWSDALHAGERGPGDAA